jgi:predicted MFS family arabinose efflux permease
MAGSRLLFCEGGNCTPNEHYRMDVSLVLSFVGLAAAAATLLGGLFRRRLGLSLLYGHIVLFAVNMTFFWVLPRTRGSLSRSRR